MSDEILSVEGLSTWLATKSGVIAAVDNVSFSVRAGRTLAIVGESGSGKSVTCQTVMRILPMNARVAAGKVMFMGEDLLKKSPRQMQAIRGRDIGMVLQDPMTSLNPLFKIGNQVAEPMKYHAEHSSAASRWKRALEVLKSLQIPAAEQRMHSYPHQFSGGMRQRVAIGVNITCAPKLLIADEPTTALDVTIQKQILILLRQIQRETGMAIILVTHDLQTVRQFSDDVAVMYAGRVVEYGPAKDVFAAPAHPYTRGLMAAQPDFFDNTTPLSAIPGSPPSFTQMPSGCRFAPRCPRALPVCEQEYPSWYVAGELDERRVACCRVTG